MDDQKAEEHARQYLISQGIYPNAWGTRTNPDYNGTYDVKMSTPDGEVHLRVEESGRVTKMR